VGLLGDGHFINQVHPDDRQSLRTCIGGLSPSNPSYALAFRFVRSDGRQFWLEETARGEFDCKGRLLRNKGLTRDITEREVAEQILAERNAQLSLAGKAALVGTFAYDTDTEIMQISEGYVGIHGFPEGTAEIARSKCLTGVHAEDIGRVGELRSQAFSKGSREYSVEYRIIRSGGEIRWVETRCFISYDSKGRPQRVIGVSMDITERKRAEEQQRALHAELDHRVKNVLATVSAVASHTRQGSRSVASFATALEGRIRSMATTHELLSSDGWRGISLTKLVRCELAAYATSKNTKIDGPEVILRPEVGQAMAIVLQELATNAAKHSALSTRNGCVSIRWDRRPNGHRRSQLVLEWREVGGPPVVPPSRPSYGTNTICDQIPYEFGGTVDLVLAPDGVLCRLELPDHWLSNGTEPIPNEAMRAPLRGLQLGTAVGDALASLA
jgi:PAS domain S-box-containing protein